MRKSNVLPTLAVMVFAMASMWVWGASTFPTPVVDDAAQYYSIAENLVQHGIFSVDGETPTLIREPGYPLYLAVHVWIFGSGVYWPIFLTQALLLAGMAGLVRWIVLMVYPKAHKAAWMAAGMTALFPPLGLYAGRIMAEVLFAFLCTLFMAVLLKTLGSEKKAQWGWGLLAGLSLGFAILTRSVLLFLPEFLMIWSVIFFRRQWKPAVMVGLLALVTISPWMIRNSIQFDTTMITTRGGYTMLVRGLRTEHTWEEAKEYLYLSTIGSTSEHVEDTYYVEGGDTVILLDPVREEVYTFKAQGWTDAQIDAYQMEKGLELVRARPFKYLSYNGVELLKLNAPHLAVYHEYLPPSLVLDVIIALITLAFYGVLLGGGLLMVARRKTLSEKEKEALWAMLGFWVYYTGIISCFDAIPRYNLPLFSLYFVATGLLLVRFYPKRYGNI